MSSNIETLVQSLENLNKLKYSSPSLAFSSHAKIEKLLKLIFDIGRKKTNFTEKQKQTLGPLMLHAIRPIQIHVERVGCQYRTSLEPSVYTKRSAIELLIKDYGDWPAGQGTKLSEELASSNIQETIWILDEVISKWREESDSDEVEPGDNNFGSEKEISENYSNTNLFPSSPPPSITSKSSTQQTYIQKQKKKTTN
ncbi:Uncharacterized protein OBRU01_16454 [Operophtera brumata]|uniref:Uncharacterized protein n=1 Tax=Operophtera brumata TaxID=104452 RepID=A0A0L7KYB3_OPEBR|nr:Uncharacterized protein OBRU01_16454 [Operophtera brumata]